MAYFRFRYSIFWDECLLIITSFVSDGQPSVNKMLHNYIEEQAPVCTFF